MGEQEQSAPGAGDRMRPSAWVEAEYMGRNPDAWVPTLKNAIDAEMAAEKDGGAALRRWVFLQTVMSDDQFLHAFTGYSKDQCAVLFSAFEEVWEIMEVEEDERLRICADARVGKRGPRPKAEIAAEKKNHMPLLHGDPARGALPGNRSKLDLVHYFLMGLVRKYRNTEESLLGFLFGVSQETASRDLVVADKILEKILPTPKKFMEIIRQIDSPEKFVDLFPAGLKSALVIFDGTHVRIELPADSARRKASISNKKKHASGNTLTMTTRDALIIGMGQTYPGTVHDITMLRSFLDQLGQFGMMLKGALPAGASEEEPVAMPMSDIMASVGASDTAPTVAAPLVECVVETQIQKDSGASPTGQTSGSAAGAAPMTETSTPLGDAIEATPSPKPCARIEPAAEEESGTVQGQAQGEVEVQNAQACARIEPAAEEESGTVQGQAQGEVEVQNAQACARIEPAAEEESGTVQGQAQGEVEVQNAQACARIEPAAEEESGTVQGQAQGEVEVQNAQACARIEPAAEEESGTVQDQTKKNVVENTRAVNSEPQNTSDPVSDALTRLLNPPKDKVQSLLDAGFQGSQKDMLGSDVHHPFKKSKNHPLTEEQRGYNKELSRRRIPVEHGNAAIKHFGRVAGTYNGSLEKLNQELNIAAGLANFRQMWRTGTYSHWAKILGLRPLGGGR